MEVTMKMYNGGDRFQGSVPFSLVEGHDNACIARWSFDAPAKGFFDVPIVLPLANGSEVSVKFPEDIIRSYPKQGVILINPGYKGDIPAHIPIAKTEEEAIEKGDELWQEYLHSIVLQWYSHCDQVRQAGGSPGSASGFTKRALKVLQMSDPGAAMMEAALNAAKTNNGAVSPDVAALVKTVQDLQAQVAQLTNTKKLRDEAEKETDKLQELDAALTGGNVAQAPAKKKAAAVEQK